jgi:hypothetical protein
MYLRILIEMDNDAFGSDGYEAGNEISRILRDYCEHLQGAAGWDRALQDSNGNTVGSAVFIDGPSKLFEADGLIGRVLGELS